MNIQGQFRNVKNELITVTITTNKDGEDIVIGSNGLYFGGNPVIINQEIDDTFTTIIRKSCVINLVTKNYVGNKLFSYNARDIEITVMNGNDCLFWGYVDPNTFNQPFIGLDEFSITAIDYLSTLQYYNYKNLTVSTYQSYKETADIVTFKEILNDILPSGKNVIYDLSKGINSTRLANVFNDLSISELVMLDSGADDIWTQEETLSTMLQYLNLHILQDGDTFYIFDWNSIKSKKTNWYNLTTNSAVTLSAKTVAIDKDSFADSDTNISIDDVFNQISVKCDLEKQDTVIESPLDDVSSLYSGKQLYMTEYISEGSGNHANSAFNKIVKGNADDYDKCKIVNWFMQVMTNPNWKLNTGNGGTIENLYETSDGGYINQWKIPKYLKDNSCTPALLRFGSYEIKGGEVTDNSPISKVDMNDYLYISINGNETSSENGHLPSDSTLQSKAPLIEYTGNNSGGAFSPTDEQTTNYLVFSGKILLQPIQYESGRYTVNRNNNYQTIYTNGAAKTEGVEAQKPNYNESNVNTSNLIKSDNNSEGRYYTRKFYNQTKPSDEVTGYLNAASLQPWTDDKSAHGYEYQYSATGNGSDKYSKLPILECELIIGNKRLIERNIDEYGNSTFEWVTVGSEPTEIIDGVSYTITTFSLGVNPKIGDYIIGDEFPIQNTIKYQMNLDAEGTAIPIKMSDRLSGKVTFRILGAINTLWNDISRRHPSFWRHTTWSSNSRFILAHTENIIIKDFKCKVYSDNGLIENSGDSELIYMSAETDNFINKKDVEFHYITQLTSAECVEKGLSSSINLNSVIYNDLPISNIYNATTNETAKAEEHFINQYYLAYSTPKILLETTIHLDNLKFNDIYSWETLMNKSFFITNISKDIRFNRATLKIKEI